jgi:hypothetical protein
MIPHEIQALFDVLQPIYGDRLAALRMEYQANPASRIEIELLLSALAAQNFGDHSAVAPPPKGAVTGGYPLGEVILGDQSWDGFGLNEDEWIQHVGVFGRSGSGKTNVGFLILKELIRHGKPFLVFDWKRNYRDLIVHEGFAHLKVLTVGRDVAPFRFNPLAPPPGTEPEVFLKKLIEILMHVYWLGEGVAYLLQTAMDETYRQRGIYDGSCRDYPTFLDIRDWLRAYKAKGREAQWMDSTRRVIETLCFGQVGKIVNTPSNTLFQQLLGGQVVLELDALANADKTFLIESILLWLHQLRLSEPVRERFKHAVLIEEAHHILLKRKESKESVMDVILREIRELGEAIIFFDQHPSLISIPSLGNSYCTVAMNLKHGNDTAALAKAMQLDDNMRESLGRLPVGDALVKLQDRWVHPFAVRFPHLAVEKGRVSDAEVAGRTMTDSAAIEDISRPGARRAEIPVVPGEDRKRSANEISDEERRLLEDVMTFPTAGIQERRNRLGLSVRQLYSLVSSLSDKALIVSGSVSTPKGRTRTLRLSEGGSRALGVDEKAIQGKRHESMEHWYWKIKLAEMLREKGNAVEVEKDGSDLVFERDGQRIAVEIETGKSDTDANVRRDLEEGFDRVISVWLHAPPPQTVSKDKVQSMALAEFLRELQ